MKKLSFILLFIIILVSCESNEPHEIGNSEDSSEVTSGISELKFNENVDHNISKEKTIEVEGKELVAPNRLFDFYPNTYRNIELEKSSSGQTRSGLGRFTTSTGVYELKDKLIKVRIADYYSKEFFPDYNLFKELPSEDAGYVLKKLNLKKGYIGFMRWEENYKYGYISIFVNNRFHLLIDIDGFSDLKENYEDLIYKFKFEN